ncbi:hypothetical protein AGMMS49960_18960 [Betaproteobacteria bacterium]|nr:hypothetical protein AGMMS49543_14720 [Betaproteobacteria bacterium]GHU03927.1 hypothetical protein AGMMS49960_18960 [Betaproteobacteria bacterium]
MSLGARIVIAAFAFLFGAIMFLHGTSADPDKAWFSYAFGAFCLFIGAASLLKGRAAQFCGSVVGTCVFLGGLSYLGDELLSGPLVSARPSQPSILNACLFLLAFGVPGILYAIKAKFGFGKVDPQQDVESDDSAFNGDA